jgi:hypothetical protein
VPFPD